MKALEGHFGEATSLINIYKFYRGWTDAKGEMSEGCDKIVFDTGIGVKVILERK